MFKIIDSPIESSEATNWPVSPRAGACVKFEGLVRNHNLGEEVSSLEYQAYKEMAEKEGMKIIKEAQEKFETYDINCIHRVGHLKIGEMAVIVHATSAHRKESFLAAQYVIDEVKLRVPIWKKEHYVNKEAEWVACHRCASQRSSILQRSNREQHQVPLG